MKIIVSLLVLSTLWSCSVSNTNASKDTLSQTIKTGSDTAKSDTFTFGKDFKLKNGQSINLNNGYSLKFENLVEDSRCPKNVTCIQAGRALIELTLLKDKDQTTITISTDKSTEKAKDYIINLKDVNTPTKASDYEITLNIQDAKSSSTSSLGTLKIQNDISEYSLAMSSTVGIGLSIEYPLNRDPSSVKFLWKTTFGTFLSWEAPDFKVKDLGKEVNYSGKKIYWSYRAEDFNKQKNLAKVTLSILDKDSEKSILDSSIEIELDEKGMARVKN